MTESATDPEDLRRYVERWRLVTELETTELRTTPPEVKLQQLDALHGLLGQVDLQALEEEDQAARRRWNRLRETLGG